jgi:hypothetical protein
MPVSVSTACVTNGIAVCCKDIPLCVLCAIVLCPSGAGSTWVPSRSQQIADRSRCVSLLRSREAPLLVWALRPQLSET